MRILQVHTRYRLRGGEDVAVEAEAELLSRAGHEVNRMEFANSRSFPIAAGQLALATWNPGPARRVHQAVKEFGPDLVHVHNTWFAASASVLSASRAAGAPVVATLHNYRIVCPNGLLLRDGRPCELCLRGSTLPAVRYRCYRESLPSSALAAGATWFHRVRHTWVRDVDRLIVLTDFARAVLKRAGIDTGRVVVKPNFTPDPGERSVPPSASRSILYVGRLSQEKGIETLIRAWRRANVSGLELRIIGDGPEAAHLRNIASGDPSIRFDGALPAKEVVRQMLVARALAVPSLAYEGHPMTMVEAFAAGLPVLASRRGAMEEIGRDLGLEWLREPDSVEDWATGLEMLRSKELVDDASRRARSIFDSRFRPDTALARLEDVYRSVVAERA